EGESYGLVLQADEKDLKEGVEKRFVYVFSIDSFGNGTLLFPRAGAGNVENRLPIDHPDKVTPDPVLQLGPAKLFKVSPPFGTDSYILLTSVQPIGDPDVLQFQGVRTRGGVGATQTPLGK